MVKNSIEVVFTCNNGNGLFLPTERPLTLREILELLCLQKNQFACQLLTENGQTDEGPVMIIFDRQQVGFDQIESIQVKPGGRVYFLFPIFGG